LKHFGEEYRTDDSQIKCDTELRKRLLQEGTSQNGNDNDNNLDIINGIDYIEVREVSIQDGQTTSVNSETVTEEAAAPASDSSSILLLLFLFREPKPNAIKKQNILILGGTRIRNIEIELTGRPSEILNYLNQKEKEFVNSLSKSKKRKLIVIKPIQRGDFSVYKLKLIKKGRPDETLTNFDPIFSQIDFSFNLECALDFDCKQDQICPPVAFDEPLLDYMAKDYASFVKLILSRFSHIIPDWKEKSAADLTNVLIELLSYVGDHLSYYQDAVSTEAYLGTARRRISVKRHARLLDYFMREGSNARTWVCLKVRPNVKGLNLKKSTILLTGEGITPDKISISEDYLKEIAGKPSIAIFETMHNIDLYSFHNEISFYSWGEKDCCLPKGSIHATLLRDNNKNMNEESLDIRIFVWETITTNKHDQNNLKEFMLKISKHFPRGESINIVRVNKYKIKMIDKNNPSKFISIELFKSTKRAIAVDDEDNFVYEFMGRESGNKTQIYGLSLIAGDVLIFEEKVSPTTLIEADRDPSHRQAVKLTSIKRIVDPINNIKLVEIWWDDEDALKFPLCINKSKSPDTVTDNLDDDSDLEIISVARGNVVLADHGYTVKNEELEDVPRSAIYYPKVGKHPIAFVSPFIPADSAYSSIYIKRQEDRIPDPAILVKEGKADTVLGTSNDGNIEDGAQNGQTFIEWRPVRDLLSSDKFANEFVVEIDNDNTAYLRFGDGKNGKRPDSGNMGDDIDGNNIDPVKFYASYRVGNGRTGNIGSGTIKRIVENRENRNIVNNIQNIYNPLPGAGGTDPETMEEVRQSAPIAFMRQERAVTEDDYSSVLLRHPEVQRAVAIFRWTGSWLTVYVTIDRLGGKMVDESFKQEIYNFLNRFRLAGYDLEINSPKFVPLDIRINVCVKPNHFPEDIKKNLLDIFGTQLLEDGKLGFFHPDNFTFGQPLYLSQIYQTVMNLEGVESLYVDKFQRMGKTSNLELKNGVIETHISEIIRVDNDPNFPDNGKIEFVTEGGI
jgi:hypothetical protein